MKLLNNYGILEETVNGETRKLKVLAYTYLECKHSNCISCRFSDSGTAPCLVLELGVVPLKIRKCCLPLRLHRPSTWKIEVEQSFKLDPPPDLYEIFDVIENLSPEEQEKYNI